MDTSASPLLLATAQDGRCVAVRRKGIKQEKLLFPALHTLLGKVQAQLKDIDRIFIIRGPGRFTGIRISLTFASMMHYLNKTRVYGATLFDVLYRQVGTSARFAKWKKQNPSGAVAVVLHAFREEYFLQIFDAACQGPQWLSREELLAQLAAYKNPLFLAGTDKDFTPLAGLVGSGYTLASVRDCRVRPQTLLAMAQEDVWTENALEPLYLKPARFELIKPV